LIMHALSKDANNRYASATALHAALLQAQLAPLDGAAVAPSLFGTAAAQSDTSSATMPEMPAMRHVPVAAVVRDSAAEPMPASSPRISNFARIALLAVATLLAIGLGVALAVR
jgi:hypothetical protein